MAEVRPRLSGDVAAKLERLKQPDDDGLGDVIRRLADEKVDTRRRRREELLDHIDSLAEGDNPPTAGELAAHRREAREAGIPEDELPPNIYDYQAIFGSWSAAVEAAGYEPRKPVTER